MIIYNCREIQDADACLIKLTCSIYWLEIFVRRFGVVWGGGGRGGGRGRGVDLTFPSIIDRIHCVRRWQSEGWKRDQPYLLYHRVLLS